MEIKKEVSEIISYIIIIIVYLKKIFNFFKVRGAGESNYFKKINLNKGHNVAGRGNEINGTFSHLKLSNKYLINNYLKTGDFKLHKLLSTHKFASKSKISKLN